MIKIYYNDNCSKCRKALDALEVENKEIEVIEYLVNTPSVQQLKFLWEELGEELIRKTDKLFNDFNQKHPTPDEWIQILHSHPILIQRPIIIKGSEVMLARTELSLLALKHF